MSLAQVIYSGVAGQQAYTITFPFLAQSHVFATVNGVAKVLTTNFTINTLGTTLTFNGTTTIANGDRIVIYRQTPKLANQRLVDFANGSAITESDLDTSALQLLYIVQEGFDLSDQALKLTTDGTDVWDALSKRLTNLAAPVGANDAIRLTDLQAALIANGNLPVVTAGNNDNMLAVVAGAWAVRTAAQCRTHLGLGTVATLNTGTGANNIPQLDGSARYPAADGRNIDLSAHSINNSLHNTPTMVVSYADTTLVNNTSGTWLTDTSGTIGRLNQNAVGESNDSGNWFSGDDANDNFTLQVGTYQIDIFVFIANTGGAASSNVDVALCNTAGTALTSFTAQTLGAKPAGATHSEPYVIKKSLIGVVVSSPTSLTLKARHNNGAGTVVAYGDATEVVVRRTS